ncbi:MAG: FAD-dependent thymidylate synthase, partial [bacterium]
MREPNTVELINHTGGDRTHALAAWASTGTELTEETEKRIPDLLEMLASNGHGTPFEHSLLSFRIQSDIASHIHILKHRAGVSLNSESARYKELR